MHTQTILNVTGLVINMLGAYLMFHFTPKVSSQFYLYTRDEYKQFKQRDLYRNRMIRRGMVLLFIGFVFQLAALIF